MFSGVSGVHVLVLLVLLALDVLALVQVCVTVGGVTP